MFNLVKLESIPLNFLSWNSVGPGSPVAGSMNGTYSRGMSQPTEEHTSRGPARWLAHKAKVGLTELPSNTGWLVKQAVAGGGNNARRAGDEVAGAAHRARESAADTVPFGKDSLDVRIKRAQDALNSARKSEQSALELAETAKNRADDAKRVSDEGKRRRNQTKKETDADVTRAVKDAQKRAEQFVAQQRAKAEAEAQAALEQVEDDVATRNEEAQGNAEEAKQDADEAIEAATEQMAEARRLADEAATQARKAAQDAHRQAQELADQADAQADSADDKVSEIGDIDADLKGKAAAVVAEVEANTATDDLSSHTKPELLEMATALDVEGRTSLRKDELITAIKKAQRAAQ